MPYYEAIGSSIRRQFTLPRSSIFTFTLRSSQGTNILLEAAILSEIDGGRLSRSSPPMEINTSADAESEVTRRSEAASALARLQDEPSLKSIPAVSSSGTSHIG